MSTNRETAEPLTPEEEAQLRAWVRSHPPSNEMWFRRLLATLDAARLSHDRGAHADPDEANALLGVVTLREAWLEGYGAGCRETTDAYNAVPAPTLPALDAETVMPCRNCGEELYDSITTWWDETVPRCPRCAADQRYPLPTVEETRRKFNVREALRDAV